MPEPGDPTGRVNPAVLVPEPEMEDLSDTLLYPPDLSDTPTNPPPAETNSEDGNELPDQIKLPSDTESDEWADWDEYPLQRPPSIDEQPPETPSLFDKKRKMKEKGEYTKKKQRGTADRLESESEVDEDPLGLVQPSDQEDANYRPYQTAARDRTANRRGRARWFEPTCNRLTTPDQNPFTEQESDKKTRFWVPTAIVSWWDRRHGRSKMDPAIVKLCN